ncbi:terminase DNA packaging enzyme small subunit [Acinetobacter phage KARL-1]|uniref:Terminase DNA packaging enzyme small subunit n=2 Tax=Lazarusvirus TaxID=2842820 RepID=A0A385IIK7_9CAUD|nr:terminase small subunit [Acinetobacter phage KARL-1]AXY82729.1 terminase DNA packaging enzyme small subunit [Acinetobacter phage KARL-1]QKN88111.1 terminase small subunit [Acinetobacter phage Abraxas]
MDIMQQILDCTDLPGMEGEELVVYQPLVLEEVQSNPTNRTPDLESDYAIVRKNLHFQQQMLMDAAKIFLETAKNADSPRHMEVFSTLMGQMTSTNKEILKVHKEMKDITNESVTATKPKETGSVNIETAQVFVGGPAEIMERYGDAFETKTRNLEVVDEQ